MCVGEVGHLEILITCRPPNPAACQGEEWVSDTVQQWWELARPDSSSFLGQVTVPATHPPSRLRPVMNITGGVATAIFPARVSSHHHYDPDWPKNGQYIQIRPIPRWNRSESDRPGSTAGETGDTQVNPHPEQSHRSKPPLFLTLPDICLGLAKCKNESCHQFHQETLLHGSPSSTETTQRPGPDGMYESTEQSGPGARLTRRSSQQFHRENPDFTAVPFSTSQSAVYKIQSTQFWNNYHRKHRTPRQ